MAKDPILEIKIGTNEPYKLFFLNISYVLLFVFALFGFYYPVKQIVSDISGITFTLSSEPLLILSLLISILLSILLSILFSYAIYNNFRKLLNRTLKSKNPVEDETGSSTLWLFIFFGFGFFQPVKHILTLILDILNYFGITFFNSELLLFTFIISYFLSGYFSFAIHNNFIKLLFRIWKSHNMTKDAASFCFNKGKVFIKNKEYREAIKFFNESIKLNPNELSYYITRAQTYFKIKFYYHTIEDFTIALSLAPNLHYVYLNRGSAYFKENNYDNALSDFNKAYFILYIANKKLDYYIEHVKNFWEKYDNGNVDWAGVIKDLNKIIKKNPINALAYCRRGDAVYRLLDFRGAIEDYSKAMELDPNSSEAYYSRGNTNFEIGVSYHTKWIIESYIKVAIQDYNKAIILEPDFAEAYYSRGIAKYYINDKNSACLDWRKAGELGLHRAYDMIRKFCKIESENTLKNDFIEKEPTKGKELENNDDKNQKETSQQRKTLSLNQLSRLLIAKQKLQERLKMLDLEEEKLKKRRIIRHTHGRNRSKYR